MESIVKSSAGPAEAAWRLAWLTPGRCRLILALVLAAGFVSHLHYLVTDCPVDLAGDEAYYWDWSRQLDWCYYSKGPMVAWLIRASCAVFGDNMPAVRFPALVLAVGTSLLTYWLTRKLFGSEKLALGAVLLSHFVPMFIAGSMMMTIDPPLYFFWGLATALAAKAVLDGRRWAWIGMGAAVGLGFLTKFSMPLWLVGLGIFLAIDREGRKQSRTPWPWLMLGVALLFTIPVVVFNIQHGAVSVKHVRADVGGTEGSGLSLLGPVEFLATQFGMMGPPLFVMMVGAVVHAIRTRGDGGGLISDAKSQTAEGPHPGPLPEYRERENARAMRLLACIGLSFFAFVFIASTFTKAQGNWPAPSYFTLMILTAYFIATRMQTARTWRRWRGWLWATVGIGAVCVVVMHDMEMLYRPVRWMGQRIAKRELAPRQWDVSFRLRGWGELGEEVSRLMADLHQPLVIAEKYDQAGELAFYVRGRPKTYCFASWHADAANMGRMSQYDLWEDRRLDREELLGRDAIYLGGGDKKPEATPPAELRRAFKTIEPARYLEVVRRGQVIRVFTIWRCREYRELLARQAQEKH